MPKLLAQNPFTSDRTRPGAIAFVFREGESSAQLIERLRANRWHGQIIGPHGSGKTSLLWTLIPLLRNAGRDVVFIRFQGGVMLAGKMRARRWRAATLVVIDGFEQVGWLARWRWRWLCRWRRCGLLVTAHRAVGLPTLCETHVDEELAECIASQLLAGDTSVISPGVVATALREQHGNLRDALFQLYDAYEAQRRDLRGS